MPGAGIDLYPVTWLSVRVSVGTREQPEKHMDGKNAQRISRKYQKTAQNRKDRRLANVDPETPKRGKYYGYEW